MIMDIGLQKKDRKLVADALSRILADTVILYLKTHNYHWNVVGPSFSMLHTLFQEQYQGLIEAADEIAERIRSLGFPAPGSFAEFTRLTALKEEAGTPESMDMIRQLLLDHELLVRRCIEIKNVAESVGDDGSADLMISRSQDHAKTSWILRSHLED